jgi:hypothetical protein
MSHSARTSSLLLALLAAAGIPVPATHAAKPRTNTSSTSALVDSFDGDGELITARSDAHIVRSLRIAWTSGVSARIPRWTKDHPKRPAGRGDTSRRQDTAPTGRHGRPRRYDEHRDHHHRPRTQDAAHHRTLPTHHPPHHNGRNDPLRRRHSRTHDTQKLRHRLHHAQSASVGIGNLCGLPSAPARSPRANDSALLAPCEALGSRTAPRSLDAYDRAQLPRSGRLPLLAESAIRSPPAMRAAPPPAENENLSVLGMGDPGLEPGTSSLSEKRSNRLS